MDSFIHSFILLLVLWFGSGRGLIPDRQLMSCRDQSKIWTPEVEKGKMPEKTCGLGKEKVGHLKTLYPWGNRRIGFCSSSHIRSLGLSHCLCNKEQEGGRNISGAWAQGGECGQGILEKESPSFISSELFRWWLENLETSALWPEMHFRVRFHLGASVL